MARRYAALLCLTFACRHEWDGPDDRGDLTPQADHPDAYGPPEPASLPTIDAVCNHAPCSGGNAQVTPLYDGKGRIAAYAHDADIQRCPHGARTWFDRSASPLAHAPRRALSPGAPQSCRSVNP
ncbi:MAG TPA: hypothetical protein VIF62_14900 [Labilithrix sp.]